MPDGADRQRARPRAGPLLLPHLLRDPQASAADHRRQHVRERELSDGAARGGPGRHEVRGPGDRRIRGLEHPAPRQAVGVTAAGDAEGRAREVENLRAVYQSLQQPQAPVEARSGQAKKVAAGAAGAGLLFVLGKAKFLGLLAGVLKFKTLATMLISIGAYAIEWGWLFALGFVLLIFVHEMGHAVAMRIEGIPAGPPVFIPFVGAFVAMQGHPRDAAVEAGVE